MKFFANPLVIVAILTGLITFSGVFIIARPKVLSEEKIVTKETMYDFGPISMEKGTVKHEFPISATGKLKIEKLYTSCMCTTAWLKTNEGKLGPFGMPGHGSDGYLGKTLEAGEYVIEVEFDPKAHGHEGVGRIERKTIIEANSKETATIELTTVAMVTH